MSKQNSAVTAHVESYRVHISSFFSLARAQGVDRYFRTPRDTVGGFEAATLRILGLPPQCRVLPVRGERWPEGAIKRAEAITHETYRALVRPSSASPARGGACAAR